MADDDYWPPDLPELGDPAPVLLLKEQASRLKDRTGGEIEGLVRTATDQGTAYSSLYLKADALGDYLYKLLFIARPAIGQSGDYPITAQNSAGGPPTSIATEDDFRAWLRAELSSDYVRSAIGNLRRYIREERSTTVG